METLPAFVPYTFIAITVAVITFLIYAANVAAPGRKNNTPTIIFTFFAIWLFLISLITFQGVFEDTSSFPPRLLIPIVVVLIAIGALFFIRESRQFILSMPITTLTYIHIIRVPVELVLWWLALENLIPMTMTFEGSNFDILTGVTAPFAAVFLVGMRSQSTFAAIVWNFAGIALLLNIVIIAIRATPYFFDASIFTVPNVAVLQFPFIWLPTFVVPAVLFAHVASIVKLFSQTAEE